MDRPHSDEKPLQSWKEIAAYLERDIRTAVRWEKEDGLPVRRLRESGRASVFAYPSEIEAWRAGRPTRTEAPPSIPLWRRPLAWAAAAVVAGAVAFIAYGPILNPKDPVAEAAEGSMRSEQVWADEAAGSNVGMSRDGKWLTYSWDGDLWLRNLATGRNRVLCSKKPLHSVESSAISPDGLRVAAAWFNADIGKYELRVSTIPPEGSTDNGTPAFRPPPDERGWVGVVGWLSDSRVAFLHAFNETRLCIADLEKNTWTVLRSFGWGGPAAVVSPDGRWIAYGLLPDPVARQNDIYLLATDGSVERIIVEHPADDLPVGWTPDGSHLLFRSTRTGDQSLWAVRLVEGDTIGAPRLASPEYSSVENVGISPEGEVYYVKRTGFIDIYEARVDFETGRLLQASKPIQVSILGDNTGPVYSPDGNRLAYISNRTISGHGGYRESVIVIRDLNTGSERVVAPALKAPQELAWSPDSSALLFRAADAKGRHGAYRVGANDDKVELVLSPPTSGPDNFGWMPGGRAVYYNDRRGFNGEHRIHKLDTGEETVVLPRTEAARIRLSPDGNRFLVVDVRAKETILSTIDVKTRNQQELHRWPLPEGYTYPSPMAAAWSPDSRTIAFWKMTPSVKHSLNAELWTIRADGGKATRTELSAEALTKPSWLLSIHPNSQRITFSAGKPSYEIWKLSNFLSRLEESD